GAVEAAAVERDEALEAPHCPPELREEHRLRVAHELEAAVRRGFLETAAGSLVPDAPASGVGIQHRGDDDRASQRPQRERLPELSELLLAARIALQVRALRVVERVPLVTGGFDVQDDGRHGAGCYSLGSPR